MGLLTFGAVMSNAYTPHKPALQYPTRPQNAQDALQLSQATMTYLTTNQTARTPTARV